MILDYKFLISYGVLSSRRIKKILRAVSEKNWSLQTTNKNLINYLIPYNSGLNFCCWKKRFVCFELLWCNIVMQKIEKILKEVSEENWAPLTIN